jgi:hypothetical protein
LPLLDDFFVCGIIDPAPVDGVPPTVDQTGFPQYPQMMGEQVRREAQLLIEFTVAGDASH